MDELPQDHGWQFEPKWDGFRCLAFRAGSDVEIKAKSGKSLTRFFPEVSRQPRRSQGAHVRARRRAADSSGGGLSFDALQMRLHPAESRIKKLGRGDAGELCGLRLPVGATGKAAIARAVCATTASPRGVVCQP